MREERHIDEEIRKIYRFIASFTNNRNDIEDLRLFKSLQSFRGQSEMKTWLFSIARNVTVDYIRKVNRQKLLNDSLLKWLPSQAKSTTVFRNYKFYSF
ncbi:RNA polymerase sigma factor [Alkalihalobacillus deserti]|uniref:RNA polymerase sigma factor n=1 Tax=Alkalihalobacillus deserti TaxID=2879466 RepID=UPI001D15B52A|nr:RNA polymerase sigma factor [Alkalihalobacillus deserti]